MELDDIKKVLSDRIKVIGRLSLGDPDVGTKFIDLKIGEDVGEKLSHLSTSIKDLNEKLVKIVTAIGSTSDNLKKATENIEKTSEIQERQTNAIIFWTAGLFFVTLVMAVIGYFQMQEAHKLTKTTQEQMESVQNATYMEYIFKFNEQLDKGENQAIALAVENNRKILRENGGVSSDDDLDAYLGVYEDLYKALQMNLISKDLFYNDFSDNLEMLYGNKEIQDYLKRVRKDSSDYFSGFESLAKEFEDYHPLK